jgi:hypothetical protein
VVTVTEAEIIESILLLHQPVSQVSDWGPVIGLVCAECRSATYPCATVRLIEAQP